jgi:hypothetical protein
MSSIFTANPQGNADRVLRYVVSVPTGTYDSTTVLPSGSYVTSCAVKILTTFTSGSSLTIGQSGSLSLFQASTDNLPSSSVGDIFEVIQDTAASALAVRSILSGSSIVSGSAAVIVRYSVPTG